MMHFIIDMLHAVRYKDILKNTYEDLRKLIKSDWGSCAIIYCHARNTCDEVASQLQADSISCRGKSLVSFFSGKNSENPVGFLYFPKYPCSTLIR